MTNDTEVTDPAVRSQPYLEVSRLSDGRYCVEVVRGSFSSRKSYTAKVYDVVKQAQRAGGLAIHTEDDELREACAQNLVELL